MILEPLKKLFRISEDHDKLLLYQAVFYGSADAVRLLWGQKRVDRLSHNQDVNTPLHLAVRSRSREVMKCKDKRYPLLWLSTNRSCDAVTERLLAERGVDINFIGGNGESQIPSTSLHHTVARANTVLLQRHLAEPGVYLKGRTGGQPPFTVPYAHVRIDEIAVVLNTAELASM